MGCGVNQELGTLIQIAGFEMCDVVSGVGFFSCCELDEIGGIMDCAVLVNVLA